jgi:hypothetical protein
MLVTACDISRRSSCTPKLDQDQSYRFYVSIRFALVLLCLLGIAARDAARLGGGER